MSKLPAIKPREMIKIFERQGYIIDRQRGSHVIVYHPFSRRRLTIPMHTKEIPTGTLLSIIKQSGLTKEEFIQLIK